MVFGEEPGSIILRTAESSLLTLWISIFQIPLILFGGSKLLEVFKKKNDKAMIPVRKAFESLLQFLVPTPMGAAEWDDSKFPLAGAKGFRAMTVGLDDDTVVGSFFNKVSDWFSELALQQKPIWEESISTSNIIPDSLSSISIKEFVGCFSKKQFAPEETNRLLGTSRLAALPKDLLADEHSMRVSFLSHLNLTSSLEAIILQSGTESESAAATSAALKMSLHPLWEAFLSFAKKRLELRTKL